MWQDDKTFLRCFRAAHGERGDVFLHVEAFEKAKRLPSKFFIKTVQERVIPDEAIYMRVERLGTSLTIYRSADGKEWTRFASQFITALPKELHVGVAAVNSTNKEFAAQFEEFTLSRTRK